MNAIGVDVGGTKIAAGVVSPEGELLSEVRYPTENVRERLLSTIAEAIAEVERGYEVGGVCLAVPGFILARENKVLSAANLQAIEGIPLKEELDNRAGLEVTVENDANAAAWGEFRFGAAADRDDDMVLVTVGTGIGGGIIIDGALMRGAHGIAAEIGHMRLVPDGRRCPCGNRGCWERYAAGSALIRDAKALIELRSPMAERLDALCQGDVSKLQGRHVTEAAAEGDQASIELIAELGRYLGEGLAQLVAVLDPGVLVIGGGVSEAGELLLEPARRAFFSHLTGRTRRPEPEIRAATLGNDAGIVGAADLARQR
jgi:glucokinase